MATSSLPILRTHFEQALLSWLRSDITYLDNTKKHQVIITIYHCVQQLGANVEPCERYWQYAQKIFHSLLENRLPDQLACRKLTAQINLLLANKIQQADYLAPKSLWRDTLMLLSKAEQKTKTITTISDSFLLDAEECLQYLDPDKINWHAKAINSAYKYAQTICTLATEIHFKVLIFIAYALENLLATLQQTSATSLNQREQHAYKIAHQSIRSLLHQAAAGTSPKQDDLFIDALFACETATTLRLLSHP